ncbi:SRPBCC family protein [Undibacterium fentianense]|uniref:SRPBCC family protein n=1 Tax=Undibacterium fentianense TaxID=2828728 RepID=A0A941E3N6_9BURK|nr:SRPBCC family protein [Undibacterium fentianense]MBR7800602.1 SRPBCC family protein [Undibacterium fentianense]
MTIVKRILIGLIGLIALIIGLAYLMPNHYGVIRSIEINATPDKIYPLIVAPKEWKKWSVWNQRDPKMEIKFSGPETGAGANWDWKSESQGNGGMKILRVANNQAINYELHFEGMGKPSSGALTLEPLGSTTKVTWSMIGSSEGNLMMKLFAPFMDKMVGPDFEDGLKNLKAVVEKA